MNKIPTSKEIYNRLKSSAKKRNIDFNLSLTEINNLTFPVTCPILGIPLCYNKDKVNKNSYSIDRIDNTYGYIDGNICVISYEANRLKSNLNIDTIEKLLEYMKNFD